jgi:hypothetical protein
LTKQTEDDIAAIDSDIEPGIRRLCKSEATFRTQHDPQNQNESLPAHIFPLAGHEDNKAPFDELSKGLVRKGFGSGVGC